MVIFMRMIFMMILIELIVCLFTGIETLYLSEIMSFDVGHLNISVITTISRCNISFHELLVYENISIIN